MTSTVATAWHRVHVNFVNYRYRQLLCLCYTCMRSTKTIAGPPCEIQKRILRKAIKVQGLLDLLRPPARTAGGEGQSALEWRLPSFSRRPGELNLGNLQTRLGVWYISISHVFSLNTESSRYSLNSGSYKAGDVPL